MKLQPIITAILCCALSFVKAEDDAGSRMSAFLPQQVSPTETISVTGTVSDEQSPLPGVYVLIKNSSRGTATGLDGTYRIEANRDDTLVFTMVGYQIIERVVDGSQINVNLDVEARSLSEVVVVGYGATTSSDVTSSITSVKSSEFNTGVNYSPDQLLQGKVPGLNITRSGNPNANPPIILRGPSTLRSGATLEPFYVIDGVPGASIKLVAPSDIVSIDVLKDASATAIYGSRAANGVIIVTTRRAKSGEATIAYNGYVAVENVSNRIEMLSAETLRNYLAANEQAINPQNDEGASNNWQDEVTKTGISHNHNVLLLSNTGQTSYIASINYFKNDGIIEGSSLDRFTLRGRVEQKELNDRLKLNVSISNIITNQSQSPSQVLDYMLTFLPSFAIQDSAGVYRENYEKGTANPVSLTPVKYPFFRLFYSIGQNVKTHIPQFLLPLLNYSHHLEDRSEAALALPALNSLPYTRHHNRFNININLTSS